jgi:hypothetical protein
MTENGLKPISLSDSRLQFNLLFNLKTKNSK